MSDDRRHDDGSPTEIQNDVGAPADDLQADELTLLLTALTKIEDAMVLSSSKLSVLLSTIGSETTPWLTDANRFGSLGGDTFAFGHDVDAGHTSTSETSDNLADVKTWVALDAEAPSGLGRIMLSWPAHAGSAAAVAPDGTVIQTSLSGFVARDNPVISGNLAIASGRAANDNVIWVGDENIDGPGGVFGREPSVATLSDGKTVIAWIGEDNIVHAKLYPGEADHADHATTAQLNVLISNLGQAAPALGADAGRLKVTALERGFAAVWVAELGFTAALVGKAFLTPAAADDKVDEANLSSGWVIHDLPAVATAGADVRQVTVALGDNNSLELGYTSSGQFAGGSDAGHHKVAVEIPDISEPGAGNSATATHTGTIDQHDLHGTSTSYDMLHVPQSAVVKRADDATEDKPASSDSQHTTDHSTKEDSHGLKPIDPGTGDLAGTPFTVGGPQTIAGNPNDGVAQTNPIVVASNDGAHYHVLSTELNHVTGTSTLKIATTNLSTHTHHELTLTKDAVTNDVSHPGLDLGPALTAVGAAGAGIAWVQNTTTADGTTVKAIAVQVIGDNGDAISKVPVIVAIGEDGRATVSGISIAGISTQEHHGHDSALDTPLATASGADGVVSGPELVAGLAVVWVKDADAQGFGAIDAQVFAVHSGGSPSHDDAGAQSPPGLVALGRDCGGGGDDDKPFQLTDNGTPVIGRAPQAEGLSDGALAVAWVALPHDNDHTSVIRGVILDTSNGGQLQDLDLSELMPNGVAAGTEPTLTSDADGDIIVGWLQVAAVGGYDHDAAVYHRGDHGHWTPPTTTIILNHFGELPQNISIIVTGGGHNPSLVVTWSDSNNDITGARFDLDGHKMGGQFDIHHDNHSGPGSGDTSIGSNGGGVSAAALPDGQFVVVCTQAGGGGSDIGAQVFSTDHTNDSHDTSIPDVVAIATVTMSIQPSPIPDAAHDTANTEPSPTANIAAPVETSGCVDSNASSGSNGPGSNAPGSNGLGDSNTGSSNGSSGHADGALHTSGGPDGPIAPVDAGSSLFTVHVDLAGDQIHLLLANEQSLTCGDGAASQVLATGPSAQDLAITIETLAYPANNSSGKGTAHSNVDSTGQSDSGSSHDNATENLTLFSASKLSATSDSDANSPDDRHGHGRHETGSDDTANDAASAAASNDNFHFAQGYGGDAVSPEIHEEALAGDVSHIAEAFDALQFANALSATGNDDILMFDTSNVVTIRSFNTLGHGDSGLL